MQNILIGPHTTEKTSKAQEGGWYAFRVAPRANKTEIKKEIKSAYGVEAVKIRIAKQPVKQIIVRGKRGKKRGFKKAFIKLKEGQKMEF